MVAKITRDIVESRLHCQFKAHLKVTGEQGCKSVYECLLADSRAEVRTKAIGKILSKHSPPEVGRDVPLTVEILRQGLAFVLDATLEDDLLSLRFDGLRKVEGASGLGDFHYVPVLFHEDRNIAREQRLLLALEGLLLSQVQGRAPTYGIIYHGRECQATRVRLNPDQRQAEQFLHELKEMTAKETPPRLLLNDHCKVCEFRQRCHEQAVREDNLSLLRGMSEKEVKSHVRKGILTVSQLAHTFRPRRKPKNQKNKAHRRYHALQALAICEKKVYVFGTPEMPQSPVRVYLDVESDAGSVYLIGMIVVQDGNQTSYSFWADSKDQEGAIFEQFLTELDNYDDLRVFCYGSYERTVLERMRRSASNKARFDRVLDRLVNVLSLIYGYVYSPCYSNGLKDVARCLGCRWTEPDASGLLSIVWRRKWEAGAGEEWKQKLLTYNQEDCAALSKVTDFISTLQSGASPSGSQNPAEHAALPVERTDDLKAHPTRRTWGTATFLIPEFADINECAYFDYQRDKVFLRA